MTWQFTGSNADIPGFLQVPVGRLQGLTLEGEDWFANFVPIQVSVGVTAIVTAGHSVEGIATSKLVAIGNSNMVQSLDFDIAPSKWIPGTAGLDIAATLISSDVLEWPTLWSASNLSASIPETTIAGAEISVVSFPDTGRRPQFAVTTFSAPYWMEPDGTNARSEFAIDVVSLEGLSGCGAFVEFNEKFAFIGIVNGTMIDQGVSR